jgi:L-cysteine desulfidase
MGQSREAHLAAWPLHSPVGSRRWLLDHLPPVVALDGIERDVVSDRCAAECATMGTAAELRKYWSGRYEGF